MKSNIIRRNNVDYIENLPNTAIPITHMKGNELKPIYWYDTNNRRVIKKNPDWQPFPYRYYQINPMHHIDINEKQVYARLSEIRNLFEH